MKNKIKIIAALLFFLSFEMTALSKSRPRPMPKSPEKIDLKKWSELRGSAYGKSQTIKGMLPNSPYPTSKNHIDFSERGWRELNGYLKEREAKELNGTFKKAFENLNKILLKNEKEEVIRDVHTVLKTVLNRWEELIINYKLPLIKFEKKHVATAIIGILFIYHNLTEPELKGFRRDMKFLARSIDKAEDRNLLDMFEKLENAYNTTNFTTIYKALGSKNPIHKFRIEVSEGNWKKLRDYIVEQEPDWDPGRMDRSSFKKIYEELFYLALIDNEKEQVIKNIHTVLKAYLGRWEELVEQDKKGNPKNLTSLKIEKDMLAEFLERVLTEPLFISESEMKDFRRDMKFLARSIDKEEKDIMILLMELKEAYRTGDFSNIYKQMPY